MIERRCRWSWAGWLVAGWLAGTVCLEAAERVVNLRLGTLAPRGTSYHKSLPADLSQFEVILIDPMLATGGSAVAAMDLMSERDAKHVRMVNLVAAPEGIRRVRAHYPDLPIFTAAVDRKLNDKGYILPGLGDAGDRIFGTA